MAETLLIVFIVFILLGMPISIALGIGALGAAILSGPRSDHHPDPLRGPPVGPYLLLSTPLFILAGNIAARGGKVTRDHRPRHRAGRALSRRARLRERSRQHVLQRHLRLNGR